MENMCDKSNLTFKRLPPILENPILFVVSQWQVDKTQPGIFYLIYRLVSALFFGTTWFIRLGAPSWAIYFSMWGYTLCTLQALLGFLLSLGTVLTIIVFKKEGWGGKFLKIHPLYWLVNAAATTVGFVISTVYWSVLYEGEDLTTKDFFIHGVNVIYLFIDLCVAGHPVRIIHMIYPLIFTTSYILFGAGYHAYDKQGGGSGHMDPIIDWDYPLRTSLMLLSIGVLVILFHLLTFVIHLMKLWTYNNYCSNKNSK